MIRSRVGMHNVHTHNPRTKKDGRMGNEDVLIHTGLQQNPYFKERERTERDRGRDREKADRLSIPKCPQI